MKYSGKFQNTFSFLYIVMYSTKNQPENVTVLLESFLFYKKIVKYL